jgi:putative endonuclease
MRNRRGKREKAIGTAAHLALGRRGEELALEHLRSLGYRIVAANFTAPIGFSRSGRPVTGEVDLIAYDESARPYTLCFVEVKTRTSAELAPPESAVDRRKQRHIVKAARLYRRMMNVTDEPFRYDVVTVLVETNQPAAVNLLRDYFSEQRFSRSARSRKEM